MTKRRIALGPRRYWSAEDDARLRQIYPDLPTVKVAAQLGRSLSATYGRAQTLDLRKSEAFLASPASGRTNGRQGIGTRFQKGLVPHNKGKPYLVAKNNPNCRRTQFKKGQRIWHQRDVGDTRMIGGYQYTKIADRRRVPWTRNWKPTHVLLWEKRRGKVPNGHAVTFRNGNRADIRLGNLKLVSRAVLMKRNSYHNWPKELARAVQLVGALQRKINRRERDHGKEQNRRSA